MLKLSIGEMFSTVSPVVIEFFVTNIKVIDNFRFLTKCWHSKIAFKMLLGCLIHASTQFYVYDNLYWVWMLVVHFFFLRAINELDLSTISGFPSLSGKYILIRYDTASL